MRGIDRTGVSTVVGSDERRPPILSGALVFVFLAGFGGLTSFCLLLSVVPLYATSTGAADVGAGLTTAALMFSTVATELVTPSLVARFGYRLTFGAGLVLLGLPALVLASASSEPAASSSMAVILAVCVVRGIGFAVIVVLGSALTASLVPPERRGEGIGVYGVVAGVPQVLALPLGVWLAQHVGFPVVFTGGTVAALAGLLAVPGLPSRTAVAVAEPHDQPVSILAGMQRPELVRPSALFSISAMAGGVIVGFLPLAVSGAARDLAPAALLVQAVATTLTRWWAGPHGDRNGPTGLIVPGLLFAAVGMFGLVASSNPVMVLLGTATFGAGFGVCQTASFAVLLERVPASGYGMVSALWNLAFDAGLGTGAAAFGVLAAQTGYSTAFAVTGAMLVVALVPARRERREGSQRQRHRHHYSGVT